jgi:hypothetical protein
MRPGYSIIFCSIKMHGGWNVMQLAFASLDIRDLIPFKLLNSKIKLVPPNVIENQKSFNRIFSD